MPGRPIITILSVILIFIGMAQADSDEPSSSDIRRMGLEARLNPEIRDTRLQEIAAILTALGPKYAHPLQGDIQYAYLLHADPEIYATLSSETIEAIDNSLESLFSFDDIDRDNHWEPLIYAYGFFNHDVTPETIRDVVSRWDELSDEEKAPRYPTYIHVIDAVCKPISVGPLANPDQTRAALELVIPAMKSALLAKPQAGTAFHPPSHACLVLGPLFERWINDPEMGPLVKEHLGNRIEFEAMMGSRLTGGLENGPPSSHMDYGYYAYLGSYLANTVARLDARSTVPALLNSLTVYEEHKATGRVIEYTQRALLALGEPNARASFEAQLDIPAQRDTCLKLAVWLARNGQGETRTYGEEKLGLLLDCPPADALDRYFRAELEALDR